MFACCTRAIYISRDTYRSDKAVRIYIYIRWSVRSHNNFIVRNRYARRCIEKKKKRREKISSTRKLLRDNKYRLTSLTAAFTNSTYAGNGCSMLTITFPSLSHTAWRKYSTVVSCQLPDIFFLSGRRWPWSFTRFNRVHNRASFIIYRGNLRFNPLYMA